MPNANPQVSTSIPKVMHPEAGRSGDNNATLRAKRSWDTALAPIKQAPMNLFIMYMSGEQ